MLHSFREEIVSIWRWACLDFSAYVSSTYLLKSWILQGRLANLIGELEKGIGVVVVVAQVIALQVQLALVVTLVFLAVEA